MLDHLIITVADFDSSRAFYLKALEPLGYEVVLEMGRAVGYDRAWPLSAYSMMSSDRSCEGRRVRTRRAPSVLVC